MAEFTKGMQVRFHPIIGGNHDGQIYTIKGFSILGHGERVAFLDGKCGCVSLEDLSIPVIGMCDSDSAQTVKRMF